MCIGSPHCDWYARSCARFERSFPWRKCGPNKDEEAITAIANSSGTLGSACPLQQGHRRGGPPAPSLEGHRRRRPRRSRAGARKHGTHRRARGKRDLHAVRIGSAPPPRFRLTYCHNATLGRRDFYLQLLGDGSSRALFDVETVPPRGPVEPPVGSRPDVSKSIPGVVPPHDQTFVPGLPPGRRPSGAGPRRVRRGSLRGRLAGAPWGSTAEDQQERFPSTTQFVSHRGGACENGSTDSRYHSPIG